MVPQEGRGQSTRPGHLRRKMLTLGCNEVEPRIERCVEVEGSVESSVEGTSNLKYSHVGETGALADADRSGYY